MYNENFWAGFEKQAGLISGTVGLAVKGLKGVKNLYERGKAGIKNIPVHIRREIAKGNMEGMTREQKRLYAAHLRAGGKTKLHKPAKFELPPVSKEDVSNVMREERMNTGKGKAMDYVKKYGPGVGIGSGIGLVGGAGIHYARKRSKQNQEQANG